MSVSGRNAPLSPVSVGGNEWPPTRGYQEDGSFPNNRGNLASPPLSAASNGIMSMNGFPSAPRSNGGGPSPPASVGRSSTYARSDRNSTATRNEPLDDSVLHEHYVALKLFLQGRDPNAKQPPNKARDKLLRLSSVQFYELSTDVYDELIRRQSAARAPPNAPNAPPTFLLPEKTFHPKRNQARQRLSSLGPPRFRDLAADVFHELERRFPSFVGSAIPRGNSAMSMRSGAPAYPPNSPYGHPPRGQSRSRMRQPSDAGSLRGPPPMDAYGVPPSPGMPPGDFGRPMHKQLSQNNTMVPNKSTMVEEDDDGDAFGPNQDRGSATTTDSDKKLIEDYQSQVHDLREKLDGMEDMMRKKEEDFNRMLDEERNRASDASTERNEFEDARLDLEQKLEQAHELNDSMRQELERMREGQEAKFGQLREQIVQLQQSGGGGKAGAELEEENQNLRQSLLEQRETTEQVRHEAQQFMREMRMLSEQSTGTYEKQLELEKTVEHLENDVREWKAKYARTKTQLRNMRASSIGLPLDQGAGNMVRERGFTEQNGIVKDVHVTKFQIAIDELLQRARTENPDKVVDAMKSVVVSVRRITRDVDETTTNNEAFTQQKPKLKAKVSSTANNLITASKNFAAGAGLSPVSLLDAAASHLTAAMVELLRIAKIRPTAAEELQEDEDDGTVTPVESAPSFSPPRQSTSHVMNTQDNLPPPPPFQGLGGLRASGDSSAYSPINSPRESGQNGMGYQDMNNGYPPETNGYAPNGYAVQPHDNRAPDLKIYIQGQHALLSSHVDYLVSSVRGDADMRQISDRIDSINIAVGEVMSETKRSGLFSLTHRLGDCQENLRLAYQRGHELVNDGIDEGDEEFELWTQTLLPIAYAIGREVNELIRNLDENGPTKDSDDDFS